MEHSFNVQFAQRYGIEEAIIVHNFYFWLRKNLANNKHIHNGRVWTYNSNKAFSELFPYINKTKVFRVLKHLEECNIILKDTFNDNLWDKTLWYAFSDNGIVELSKCGYDVLDFVKMNHRDNQSETTIPYSKQTDSITDNKEKEDKSSKKKNFVPPTIEEVAEYIKEKGYHFSAESFWCFYESKGWMVGKNKMKIWKAACATWESKYKEQLPVSSNEPVQNKKDTIINGVIYR